MKKVIYGLLVAVLLTSCATSKASTSKDSQKWNWKTGYIKK